MLTTKMNPRVFWGASAVAGGLLLLALIAPSTSDLIFKTAQAWVIDTFGWFYVAAVAGFGPEQSRTAVPGQAAYELLFWKKE